MNLQAFLLDYPVPNPQLRLCVSRVNMPVNVAKVLVYQLKFVIQQQQML